MNNQDVIRAHKALCTEFYEFRDATLNESKLTEPSGVVNLLEKTSRPASERVTKPIRTLSDLLDSSPAVEIVPQNILASWLSQGLSEKYTTGAVGYRGAHLRNERQPHQLSLVHQFVMLFCESMLALRSVCACVAWTLEKSSHSAGNICPQEITNFFQSICTDAFEGTKSPGQTISNVLESLLDRWDNVGTQLVYGHSFAGKIRNFDKFSSATTFTNRLFGAWYAPSNSVEQESGAESIQIMRVLNFSPRQKKLSECLRHFFAPDSIEKHRNPWRIGLKPITFPEIMLVCVERANENDLSDRRSSKTPKCSGFPQRIIFSSELDHRRQFEESCDDFTTIQISTSRQVHEEYTVYSIGFFEADKAETSFCMALRSTSPHETQAHGVWFTVSRDGKNPGWGRQTRISSLEELQRKAICYTCYVKTTCAKTGTLGDQNHASNTPDLKEESKDENSNVPSWHGTTTGSDSSERSSSDGESHPQLTKNASNSRPLMVGTSAQQASLPQERILGEPMYDEEWNEALDKGKGKKSKSTQQVFPKGNTFQRFQEMGDRPLGMGKSRKHRRNEHFSQ